MLSTRTRAVSLSTRNGVSDSHRDGRCSAGPERKAPLAGLHRELPVVHDVALILRMGVARRRGAARKRNSIKA